MGDGITELEHTLRLTAFLAMFALMAAWEALAPRRRANFSRRQRWPHNLALLAIDVLALRLLVPGAAIAVAVAGETQGWGFLQTVDLPTWAEFFIAIAVLDLAIYSQHVLFHAVPVLWRLHRVHHADPDFDVTTGTRFHPLEILLSVAIKCLVVAALGAPAVAVLVFEVLLNATAMFNHANARLPAGVDRYLRWLIVTPDMHRVHHSIIRRETDSNFSFNLPWWDRLFGTYRAQPEAGHLAMKIGTEGVGGPQALRIGQLLTQPFSIASVSDSVSISSLQRSNAR